jgi:hypothetical protein
MFHTLKVKDVRRETADCVSVADADEGWNR